jgi:hypothetical protein
MHHVDSITGFKRPDATVPQRLEDDAASGTLLPDFFMCTTARYLARGWVRAASMPGRVL